MSEFQPPEGPPPPKVPEGWKALWNEQYKEWYYVNTHTKKSQWDKPTVAAEAPAEGSAAHPYAPPSYDEQTAKPVTGTEKGGLGNNNNPYNDSKQPAGQTSVDEDEKLARKLQAEEDSWLHGQAGTVGASSDRFAGSGGGAAQGYYGDASAAQQQMSYPNPGYGQQQQQSPYGYQQAQPAQQYGESEKSKAHGGFLSKLLGAKSSRPSGGQGQYYGPPAHPPYGYPAQPGYGAGGAGGGMMRPGGGRGGGLGIGGAAALGVGGGLLGGVLLADAMENHDQNEYQEGYQDGGQNSGDYGGGDYGGGDYGGGDFGGGGF